MKCKHFKDWLYLYGDDELTPAQQQQLDRHLAGCPDCRREQRVALQMADRVRQSRGIEPEAPEPAELTQQILNRIAAQSLIEHTPKVASRGFNLFMNPSLRLAMAMTVLIIVGVFALQSVSLLSRVSRLEQKFAAQTTGLRIPELDPALVFGQESDWVLGRISFIQRLIHQRPHLPIFRQSSFWRRIQNAIPDMAGVTLEDGLSTHEILILLKHKEEILEMLPTI